MANDSLPENHLANVFVRSFRRSSHILVLPLVLFLPVVCALVLYALPLIVTVYRNRS
jgi:hypothetical protein